MCKPCHALLQLPFRSMDESQLRWEFFNMLFFYDCRTLPFNNWRGESTECKESAAMKRRLPSRPKSRTWMKIWSRGITPTHCWPFSLRGCRSVQYCSKHSVVVSGICLYGGIQNWWHIIHCEVFPLLSFQDDIRRVKRDWEKSASEKCDLTSKIEELNLYNDSSEKELRKIIRNKQVRITQVEGDKHPKNGSIVMTVLLSVCFGL